MLKRQFQLRTQVRQLLLHLVAQPQQLLQRLIAPGKGVIASLTGALAEAGISVFVVSSFNTDFVLVREQDLAKALGVLEEDGHYITGK